MESKQTVQVLWTGGMDSTLIMIQLSQLNVRILPIYISNANGRTTEAIELSRMNEIYEKLKKDKRTSAELLPIRIVADDISQIPDVTKNFEFEFFKRVRYKETITILRRAQKKILDLQVDKAPGVGGWKSNIIRLAEQYAPVMSYAKADNTIVEIGIHGDESFFKLPELYKMKKIDCGEFTRYMLDENGTDPDLYGVFKNVSFILYPMNKVTVYEAFAEMDYISVRNRLWHCYAPIDGKPCGKCNTCVPYIREGMYDMFDRDALLRYIKFCDREREVIEQQYKDIITRIKSKA